MKRFVFLLCAAFMMTVASFASDFTTNNKKSGGEVYSIGVYSATTNVAVATDAKAMSAHSLFNLSSGQLLYFRGSDGKYRVTNGTAAVSSGDTPAFGQVVLTGLSSDAKYVALYDSILICEQNLYNLELADHGTWGSKVSAAASVSSSIKSEIGSITNNNPFLNLENAIKTAYQVFNTKNQASASYAAGTTDLSNAEKGSTKMFNDLELLRDYMALLKQVYQGTTYTKYDADGNVESTGNTASRALSEYPCAADMFDATWSQVLQDFAVCNTLAGIESDIEMVKSTETSLYKNVANYSDEDLAFFDKMMDPTQYTEATSNNDYPTIPNISKVEYLLFVKVPSQQLIDHATKFAKEVASWAGSAPFVSYPGIAMATAQFAVNMYFAGCLMAENIRHMQTLQTCIDWLNLNCQSDYAYAFLSDECARSRMNLRSCENSAIAELQHGILKDALTRAKELSALGESQKALQELIFEAQDMYYDMPKYRENKLKNESQAKKNLRKALTAAEMQKDIQYVIKTVTYDYSVNGGEYSLYNFEWYAGNKVFTNDETPHSIVDRETQKLQNAMDLYSKQYELEQKLDECMSYMDDEDVWGAAPQKTVKDAWQLGETFNDEVSLNQHLINDDNNNGNKGINTMIADLNSALALAKTQQATIDAEVADTEEKIENSENNGPIDYLEEKLEEAIDAFKQESDWDDVNDAINQLNAEEVYQAWFDKPDVYSDYMIHKADSFFEVNATLLTPNQIVALDQALAAARIANAEYKDERYQNADELKRKYILDRMYYSSLALEYALLMTTPKTASAELTPEQIAQQQLAEAIFFMAVAAVSKSGDIDDFYAVIEEGNDIFRSKTATADDKAEEARKIRALLNMGGTTAINGVEGAEQLRDGKYIQNGQLIIVKGGKKFNAAGVQF